MTRKRNRMEMDGDNEVDDGKDDRYSE